MNFKKTLTHSFLHSLGWKTKRKIVVIESDDWGSIRMPSRNVYEKLLKSGLRVDILPYNRYDSLASETDLVNLFDVLASVKDKNRNSPVITANTIVANPDFEKIRLSGYQEYHYEVFTETLKRYDKHVKSFELWKEGMKARLFHPQFHGREHLNVSRWMHALSENIGNVRLAFDYEMFDLSITEEISENSFMESLNIKTIDELEFQKKSIEEGTSIFFELFGYKARTFIAPCYTWSNALNVTLQNCGIIGFQGNWFQFEPVIGESHRFKKRFHYIGQKNRLGQRYIVRNASFEPSINKNFDWIGDVLDRTNLAFKFGKPAVIGTHRLNYIGFIDEKNSSHNLVLFKNLLIGLLKKWPDVEFMTSDEVIDLMESQDP